MSNATLALAKAILDLDEAPDADELDAFIQNFIRGGDNAPPEPVNTIDSIANDEGLGTAITLYPFVTFRGEVEWALYIPPTTKDAFEYGEDEADFDPMNNDIKAPWGEVYWESLTGAVASLALAVKNGDVKFNDGRVAK